MIGDHLVSIIVVKLVVLRLLMSMMVMVMVQRLLLMLRSRCQWMEFWQLMRSPWQVSIVATASSCADT